MKPVRMLMVVGARPQFVKVAAISRAVAARDDIEEILLHTGQHFDAAMSRVFFDELGIPAPRINLGIHGGSHGEMTGRMLAGIEEAILAERPDIVLVPGRYQLDAGRRSWRRPNCMCRWRISRRVCARSTAECRKRSTAS